MLIAMFEPPEAQRIGGLDLAIRSLEAHIEEAGFESCINPSLADLDALRPAIVHFHGLWQRNYSAVANWCRASGTPYVVSPHGMLEPWAFKHKWWKKWPYFYLLERQLMRRAASLIATGIQERDNLFAYTGHGQIEIVPLAISSEEEVCYETARIELGYEENEKVLVYLSRVHPKKGLQLLLQALMDLRTSLDNVRLVIVGDGENPFYEQMRAKATELGRNCRVDWHGAVWGHEKWKYLQAADLFCLPTYSENFGLAVLEACQVGTPVLTTNATPWSFLNDWGAGLITNPNVTDVRDSLVQFLTTFEWTPSDRERLAERAHDEFSSKKITARYVGLYERLAEGFSKHPISTTNRNERWSRRKAAPSRSI